MGSFSERKTSGGLSFGSYNGAINKEECRATKPWRQERILLSRDHTMLAVKGILMEIFLTFPLSSIIL
jgi:hypothetical protein